MILLTPLIAPATATKIKVKKVKGQMAVVQFQGKMLDGENYLLVPGDGSEKDLRTGPRNYRLGVSLNFTSLKTKTSSIEYNPNEFTINSDFGWNYESYELGPILGYSSSSTGFGGSTTYLTVGAFYDYNFTDNKDPISYLFGTGLRLTYVNITPASGSSGLYNMIVYPNLFWKWWAFGHSTAFKADIGYDIENGKDSAASSVSTSGIKSTAAILLYF